MGKIPLEQHTKRQKKFYLFQHHRSANKKIQEAVASAIHCPARSTQDERRPECRSVQVSSGDGSVGGNSVVSTKRICDFVILGLFELWHNVYYLISLI